MKRSDDRPVQPVAEYEAAEYPTTTDVELGRRAFFKRVAATGAVTAGAVALSGEAGAAPFKDTRERVSVRFSGSRTISGTSLRAERVEIFTADKKLARFVREGKELTGLRNALQVELRKIKPEVLESGRKLYKLERKLAAAIAKRYRKRTGRFISAPDLMLHIGKRRYRHFGGVMVRPRRPIRPIRRRPVRRRPVRRRP